MEYRIAEQADAEPIAGLHADSWRRTYRGMYLDAFLDGDLVANRREVWRERLSNPPGNQRVYVATADTQIAGFICAYGAEHAEWGSFVDNLHVAHTFHRRGVGAALMRQAGAWLASAYADCGVYLHVLEANHTARRFYETLGAANSGTMEIELTGGGTGRTCRYVWSSAALLANLG